MRIVGEPETVVGADRDAVGSAERALAPRAQKRPLPVEDDHGMGAAVKDVDVVPGVDRHARGLDERPSLRQLSPSFDRAVVHRRPPRAAA